MKTDTTIELPRLPDESARAYAARVEYVTMGAGRSLEKLSQKSTKNVQLFKRWSTQFGWVDSARQYDEQLSYITIQEAAQAHRADMEEYRARYRKAGKDLCTVAQAMLGQLARQLQGGTVELNAGTLGQVKGALQTAADLEALALRVDHLLGTMDEPGSE